MAEFDDPKVFRSHIGEILPLNLPFVVLDQLDSNDFSLFIGNIFEFTIDEFQESEVLDVGSTIFLVLSIVSLIH